jgi:hypothetical protein
MNAFANENSGSWDKVFHDWESWDFTALRFSYQSIGSMERGGKHKGIHVREKSSLYLGGVD